MLSTEQDKRNTLPMRFLPANFVDSSHDSVQVRSRRRKTAPSKPQQASKIAEAMKISSQVHEHKALVPDVITCKCIINNLAWRVRARARASKKLLPVFGNFVHENVEIVRLCLDWCLFAVRAISSLAAKSHAHTL